MPNLRPFLAISLTLALLSSVQAQNFDVKRRGEVKIKNGYLYFHTWEDAQASFLVVDKVTIIPEQRVLWDYPLQNYKMQFEDLRDLVSALREAKSLIGKLHTDKIVGKSSTSPGWVVKLRTSPAGEWVEWHPEAGHVLPLSGDELSQVLDILKATHDTMPHTKVP